MERLVSMSLRLIILLPVVMLVSSCVDRSMHDLKSFVSEVKSRKAGHIEPLPEIKQIETFAYNGEGRRNPFAAPAGKEEDEQQTADNGISPDFNRRKEELEGFTLDSLRMVGILEQLETTWALVRTKDMTIYRVKAGNYMGKNHGQISRVTEDKIFLTEIVSDGRGGYIEREASLALAD
jgi:type IV pilus assembly protein PilP